MWFSKVCSWRIWWKLILYNPEDYFYHISLCNKMDVIIYLASWWGTEVSVESEWEAARRLECCTSSTPQPHKHLLFHPSWGSSWSQSTGEDPWVEIIIVCWLRGLWLPVWYTIKSNVENFYLDKLFRVTLLNLNTSLCLIVIIGCKAVWVSI